MNARGQYVALQCARGSASSELCDRTNKLPTAELAPAAKTQDPCYNSSGSPPCLDTECPQTKFTLLTCSLLGLEAPASTAALAPSDLCAATAGPNTPPASNPPATAVAARPLPGEISVPAAAAVNAAGVTTATPNGPSAAATAAAKAAAVLVLWRRAQAFMHTLLGSPVVMSALLALELEGTHPVQAQSGAHGLKWTLAQMLALHLKAGYTTATEAQLLATLWTLESFGNVWRSPCTAALQSYLQHLTAFDTKRAMGMSSDWPNQFRSLRRATSESQLDLLKKLDWRLCLDFDREVAPCRSLLFKAPQAPATPTHATALGGGSTPPPTPTAGMPGRHGAAAAGAREEWVHRMEALCSLIQQRAAEVVAARDVDIDLAAAEEGDEEGALSPPSPPKRQRLLGAFFSFKA